MTKAPSLLGPGYDEPATFPLDARHPWAKQRIAESVARRLKQETHPDAEALDVAWWEVGLLQFSPVPTENGPYPGGSYEAFAEGFGVTEATVNYAAERAAETKDIVLRIHYLAFVLARSPQTGRAWIERQRELLDLWRDFVESSREVVATDTEGHIGLFIERALQAMAPLLSRPGVLRGTDATDWAKWLVQLAYDSQEFPPQSDPQRESMQRRWVAPYLRTLTALPPSAATNLLRQRTIELLNQMAAYYRAKPLMDTFSHLVSEICYAVRRHWGDTDAHKELIREQYEALIRRAEIHKNSGSGMLAQHFFRQARLLADEHGQYFARVEVDRLMQEERAAIKHAEQSGEFKRISASVEVPREMFERLRDTPELTVADLIAEVASPVVARSKLEALIRSNAAQTPLQSLFPTAVFGDGKLLGESRGEEQNLALDVERFAIQEALLAGQAISMTIIAGAASLGLSADHVIAPFSGDLFDAGTVELIRRGCDRLIQQDFVAACHILIPRVEDGIRQRLRMAGLHATEFRRDIGSGTTRTDDEPLGSMLSRALPDGRTVRSFLGEDFAFRIECTMTSQTGLALRHIFAHGLARPESCSPQAAGVALSILFKLTTLENADGGAAR